jgi:hypothetical protein
MVAGGSWIFALELWQSVVLLGVIPAIYDGKRTGCVNDDGENVCNVPIGG